MVLEVVRLLNSKGLRDVDPKAVIPYLPLLEIFRAARGRELTLGVPSWPWEENRSG